MRFRIELPLYVEADNADEVREIAEKVRATGEGRANELCSEATMTRGEPIPVASSPAPVAPAPLAGSTRTFDTGASAC